jgi:hypothetical protein
MNSLKPRFAALLLPLPLLFFCSLLCVSAPAVSLCHAARSGCLWCDVTLSLLLSYCSSTVHIALCFTDSPSFNQPTGTALDVSTRCRPARCGWTSRSRSGLRLGSAIAALACAPTGRFRRLTFTPPTMNDTDPRWTDDTTIGQTAPLLRITLTRLTTPSIRCPLVPRGGVSDRCYFL